nr:uncharacterized protein LOC111985790 isoform X1 [Quercus suber]
MFPQKIFLYYMDMMEVHFNSITLIEILDIGIVDDIFNVLWYWKSHKYLQPNHWLQSWLRREIQALIQVCKLTSLMFPYEHKLIVDYDIEHKLHVTKHVANPE